MNEFFDYTLNPADDPVNLDDQDQGSTSNSSTNGYFTDDQGSTSNSSSPNLNDEISGDGSISKSPVGYSNNDHDSNDDQDSDAASSVINSPDTKAKATKGAQASTVLNSPDTKALDILDYHTNQMNDTTNAILNQHDQMAEFATKVGPSAIRQAEKNAKDKEEKYKAAWYATRQASINANKSQAASVRVTQAFNGQNQDAVHAAFRKAVDATNALTNAKNNETEALEELKKANLALLNVQKQYPIQANQHRHPQPLFKPDSSFIRKAFFETVERELIQVKNALQQGDD